MEQAAVSHFKMNNDGGDKSSPFHSEQNRVQQFPINSVSSGTPMLSSSISRNIFSGGNSKRNESPITPSFENTILRNLPDLSQSVVEDLSTSVQRSILINHNQPLPSTNSTSTTAPLCITIPSVEGAPTATPMENCEGSSNRSEIRSPPSKRRRSGGIFTAFCFSSNLS